MRYKILFLSLLLSFSSITLAVPDNNDFNNATVISSLPFTATQNTDDATLVENEAIPTCAIGTSNPDKSIWFSYTPSQDQTLILDTFGSDFDTVLTIFTGSDHPLAQDSCNNNYKGQLQSQIIRELFQDITYYIGVYGYNQASGDLVFNAQLRNPLANDSLSDAITVTTIPYLHAQTTEGATTQSGESSGSCVPSSGSVWFQYTPTTDQSVVFSTVGSDYEALMTVWTGSGLPLTEVACVQSLEFEPSRLNLALTSGTTYYISVAGEIPVSGSLFGEQGNLVFSMTAPPSNDNLANATAIDSLPFAANQATDGASMETDEVNASCAPNDASVWYTYTATSNQNVSFSTLDSGFDTVLSLWQGNSHPLTEVACNDDAVSDEDTENRSQLTAPLTAGDTYLINVSGLLGSSGNLLFNVQAVTNDLLISQQPQAQNIASGEQATLTVTVTGSTPLAYQWYQGPRGETAMPVGTNSRTFTSPPLTQQASYWVRITNPTGSIDSDDAFVFVEGGGTNNGTGITPLGNPIITQTDFSGTIVTDPDSTDSLSMVQQTDEVIIRFTAQVDAAHVGQTVDLIMAVIYAVEDAAFGFVRNGTVWENWDGAIDTLANAATGVSLDETLALTVFSGALEDLPGEMAIYVGYQLPSGDIIYNREALVFMVE